MSAFLDLRDAIVALLLQTPAVANGFVLPGRTVPLPLDKTQGVFVRQARAGGEQPHVGDGETDWSTTFIVTCLARADGTDGDTAVDPLLMAVYARLATGALQATQDSWTLDPAIDWDVEEANETLGGAAMRLVVQHRTADGALTPAT